MAKILNVYRGYTASDINTRSSNTGDHSVVSSTVEFTNITTSKIGNVLGDSSHSVSALCTSTSVNHWSGFGPTVRTYSNSGTVNGTLVNSDPTTNYQMGSFAGYNHSAPTPGWSSDPQGLEFWTSSGSQALISVDVLLGEVDFPAPAASITLSLWAWGGSDYTEYRGYSATALSGLKNTVNIELTTSSTYFPLGVTANTTLMGKVFIADTTSGFESNYSDVLCIAPGTDFFTFMIKIRTASDVSFNGWPVSVSKTYGWAAATGIFTLDTMIDNTTGYTDIQIRARLVDDQEGQQGSDIIMYDTAVDGDIVQSTLYSNIPADFSAGAPYPSDGMHLTIYWESGS